MDFLVYISNYIIPLVIFYIVGFGLMMKINVYEEFTKGAADGFKTVIKIMPTLVGLMVAVGILRASGFLDFLGKIVGMATDQIGFPSQLVPLVIVRMFSSSAATGLILDVFKEYGPDSILGTMTSIMMSCTETIFYTLSVYFMTAKVKKSRYTLTGALLATLTAIIASVVMTNLMM